MQRAAPPAAPPAAPTPAPTSLSAHTPPLLPPPPPSPPAAHLGRTPAAPSACDARGTVGGGGGGAHSTAQVQVSSTPQLRLHLPEARPERVSRRGVLA
jgi:hypothetical protein